MRKKCVLMFLTSCIILTIAVQCISQAADKGIYIRNQPYTGEVITKGKDHYIQLEDFAKRLKLNLHQKGTVWCLTTPSHGDEKCCLDSGETGLFVNGEKFSNVIIRNDGKIFVPLEQLSKAAGALYSMNKATGIIDVTFPRKGVTQNDILAAQSTPAVPTGLTLIYYFFNG
ncbi:MAG: hypothetical protein AB9903_15715 [Vulcanimicrobiota bacterium]